MNVLSQRRGRELLLLKTCLMGISPTRRWGSGWEGLSPPKEHVPAESNLTPRVWGLTKRKLYQIENHPIATLKGRITDFFQEKYARHTAVPVRPKEKFILREDFDCVVSVKRCFDELQFPPDHIARKPSDTYYINKSTILRTHTSVHQIEMLQAGHSSFLIFGLSAN
jgi:phenylalanyl-tRNA synthetase alpha chain